MSARTAVWPVLALVFNAFTWGVSWWPFRRLEAQGFYGVRGLQKARAGFGTRACV